jgi:ribonuclease HI
MATKINNLEYDTPLEVRYWQHPAKLVIIHELDNSTIYTTEVYTDGSKFRDSLGTAGILFANGKLVHQLKFTLHGQSTNNQAEQAAIFKVLEKVELQDGQDNDKCVAIYTDSTITFDLLQNKFEQNQLI